MARPNRFRDRLRDRGITTLMHFTPAQNLPSIVEHGLLPAQTLDEAGLPYVYTDGRRLDGARNAISLSITCCNWAMLSRLRRIAPRQPWVLIGLNAELMVGANCSFYQHNAASGCYARDWKQYRGLQDFENMFADFSPSSRFRGSSYRGDHGIPPRLTTDPQAEVLHFGGISAEWIDFVIIENAELAEAALPLMEKLPGFERTVYRGEFVPCFSTPFDYAWGMTSPQDILLTRLLEPGDLEAPEPG